MLVGLLCIHGQSGANGSLARIALVHGGALLGRLLLDVHAGQSGGLVNDAPIGSTFPGSYNNAAGLAARVGGGRASEAGKVTGNARTSDDGTLSKAARRPRRLLHIGRSGCRRARKYGRRHRAALETPDWVLEAYPRWHLYLVPLRTQSLTQPNLVGAKLLECGNLPLLDQLSPATGHR